jgi:hypothetical protein
MTHFFREFPIEHTGAHGDDDVFLTIPPDFMMLDIPPVSIAGGRFPVLFVPRSR